LWLLFPLQLLHTPSYAATFLASLQLVERLSTPRNASAAQAINSALSSRVLSGLATMDPAGCSTTPARTATC
jgi:PPP family 3-phenylpropionic acid transporter